MRRVDIIPLIGGMSIAGERAFGSRPDYFVSWTPFAGNDRHIVEYYDREVPYVVLDDGGKRPHRKKIDVVASVCPCAGLSLLSGHASADNAKNEWMYRAAEYVLTELRPEVYWGENAPQLAGKLGAPVRERLRRIGREHGYTLSLYTTKSLLHGTPQVRARSFYFFWKGDKTPVLEYFDEPITKIEDVIASAKGNTQQEVINEKTPSRDDPYYRFILEHLHGGATHREFVSKILDRETARNSSLSYIEKFFERDWRPVRDWLKAEAARQSGDRDRLLLEREVSKCEYRIKKKEMGKGYMLWSTCWPKGYIGAFVSHLPHSLTHPRQDRYITYREAMTIMGLPQDFQLQDASKRNTNHICQNVPVKTATDMANEVKAYLEGKRQTVRSKALIIQRNESRVIQHEGEERPTLDAFLAA